MTGFIKSIFAPSGDKGGAGESDILKVIDGYLLKGHRNALGDDERYHLGQLAAQMNLDEKALEGRLKAALDRKSEDAKRQKELTAPDFVDDGVVLASATMRDEFLKYDDPHVGGIERYLVDPPKPLPDLPSTRWHRWPSDDEKTFEYLLSILQDLAAGKIKPGRVSYVQKRGERFEPTGRDFPVVFADNPPMAFRLGEWSFIRRRGQSQKQFLAALEELTASVEEEQRRNGMVPADRPLSAPVTVGGPGHKKW